MNHFYKKSEESFFIDANIPHSYIYGNCLELMNCSDNVIRLGLKLVEKENFDKIIKKEIEEMIYDENDKDEVKFIHVDKENKITTYDIDFIDDFKLKVFDIDKNRNIKMEKIVFYFT